MMLNQVSEEDKHDRFNRLVAAVNERVLAGEGAGGNVFINSQNVLPEELNIITNTYGTQWSDSRGNGSARYRRARVLPRCPRRDRYYFGNFCRNLRRNRNSTPSRL